MKHPLSQIKMNSCILLQLKCTRNHSFDFKTFELICFAAGDRAKNTADRRLKGIVQRRKLVDLAKAQAQEVAVLRAEVERLRMKTFPALVQVER